MLRLLFILSFIPASVSAQGLYKSVSSEISFFSKALLEDIYAVNKDGKSLINTDNKDIVVILGIRGFKFEKSLMEEHFNENYMESNKYKTSTFKGKINEEIDFTKDGIYPVTATGVLEMHGVSKDRTIKGTLTIKNNQLLLNSKFDVQLEDHKIKIPKAVIKKIAESVEVTNFFIYEQKLD
jgi:polyisoprenoid-binding protein YceI